jgi:hypothetical protein
MRSHSEDDEDDEDDPACDLGVIVLLDPAQVSEGGAVTLPHRVSIAQPHLSDAVGLLRIASEVN